MTYKEEIKSAIQLSKRTGQSIRKTFDRDRFLKEFPEGASDPRMAAYTPDHFILDITPLEAISVLELRQLCEKKKGHPVAELKRASIFGLSDDMIVYVLREELDILKLDSTILVASGYTPDSSPPISPSDSSPPISPLPDSPVTKKQK